MRASLLCSSSCTTPRRCVCLFRVDSFVFNGLLPTVAGGNKTYFVVFIDTHRTLISIVLLFRSNIIAVFNNCSVSYYMHTKLIFYRTILLGDFVFLSKWLIVLVQKDPIFVLILIITQIFIKKRLFCSKMVSNFL